MAIRKNIKITSIGERQDIPNKNYQSLEFFGIVGDQEYKFVTYKSSVMDALEVDKVILADVEIEPITVNSGNKEPKRIVTRISEKQINKDVSIESQVAVYSITNLRVAGVEHDKELDQLADDWCKKALNRSL